MRLELRSLAVFRVALGLLLLSQCASFFRDFDAFYGASGIFPRSEWNGALLGVSVFGLLPLFSGCLLVGFFTRLSTFLSWIVLVAVQDANPQILQGGDILLRLLLFWSLFLPLGQVGSIDSRFRKSPAVPLPWTTRLASWALTFQICFVYWFAFLLKSDALWTQSGNALFYALNIEHFTTPFGLWLRQFPGLLRVLTFATLGLELLGPCLLFIPYRRDGFRLLAVMLFIGFHLIGMQAFLRIGIFPWVCATAWLIFIPGSFWDWLMSRGKALPKGKKAKARQEAVAQEKTAAALFNALATALGNIKTITKSLRLGKIFDHDLATRLPLKILVVEDNVINQKVALRVLLQFGYQAELASNGKEALEALEQQKYDLLFMDVQMSEMDGLEATRRICARL